MMENRKILNTSDLDGFDKRKLPSPGFQVEVVLVDYDRTNPARPTAAKKEPDGSSSGSATTTAINDNSSPSPDPKKESGSQDKDDVFSDSEAEDSGSARNRHVQVARDAGQLASTAGGSETKASHREEECLAHGIEQVSLRSEGATKGPDAYEVKIEKNDKSNLVMEAPKVETSSMSEFKAIAADASVFSFGDEDEYESE